jgi:hypothetical protein
MLSNIRLILRLRHTKWTVAFAMLALFTFPLRADIVVNVTFNGFFYDVGAGATSAIPMGTTYTATLQYDASTTGPVNFTPSPGDFFNAQIGGYSVHGTPTSYQVLPSGQDFLVQSTLPAGSIPGLTDPVTMSLDIDLCCSFFFNPNQLPTSFAGLPPIDRVFVIHGSGTFEDARASAVNITATIVPEPESWTLLLGTLAIIFAVIHIRRRQLTERA